MMDSVRASPKVIGGQSHDADHPAKPVVRHAPAEKRSMAAIMLDHDWAHEKASRRNGKQQAKPVPNFERGPHQEPEENKRHHRNHDLKNAACTPRFAVAGKALSQRAWIAGDGEICYLLVHATVEISFAAL